MSGVLSLHRAIEAAPELRDLFLAGKISHDAVVAVGQIVSRPSLIHEGEDWIEAAVKLTTARLIDLVRRRRAEARTGGPTIPLKVYLSPQEKQDFLRAKNLVSRNGRKPVTEAEAVVELVRFYRDKKDPLLQAEGTRRMPDTTDLPGRTVPASVQREVARWSSDRCQVPTCGHEPFVDNAHWEPHADGGSREVDNIGRLCRIHHILKDYGLMRVEGPPSSPTFYDRDGKVIGGPDPPIHDPS